MPAAEVPLPPELIRRLLAAQHPDLAELPLTVLAHGWDNLVCRLGTSYLVRLPRRAAAAGLVRNEQRWLPSLAPRLPLPVPAPVREGVPGCGYPWAWSVVPYLPGETAAHTPPADPGAAARTLGAFLGALHTPASPDAPVHTARGVPLARRAAGVAENLAALGDPAADEVWRRALAAPEWTGPPLWLHGDLHPANILVHDGELSGVVDFGDLTGGDPATDLAAAWMLFPREADRDTFRAAHGRVDEATWTRARGWALALGLVFVTHSADNPLMAGVGRRTVGAVLGKG
ncbi:aminoglycoside phosphotransferase family protein [Streptomyces sp. NPDC047046]|uniref:aminoglycoside phosphotransferase family protein n=1 Tax=Streptomyces sp. NPDC047046 TaxID=3155378 RepID=UPI0033F8AB4A